MVSHDSELWQVPLLANLPDSFLAEVQKYTPHSRGEFAAQLLWQRGIRDPNILAGFVNPDCYQPSSPFEFGTEMHQAVQRLYDAYCQQDKVAIWGDFDADGITSTAVLWEGLGEFFPQQERLIYYIPNRLTESHGLNQPGIEFLYEKGYRLIVTCDTGSTNLAEIELAQKLGIDVIVTDHHTLPLERPPVVAIINPRYLSTEHPLYHLSGVAVAYKLIEALYLTYPEIPQRSSESLLDLVAIGLIADLVQLVGDARYLAQRGMQRLQQQFAEKTRPGLSKLLELCRGTGDRPMDISYGIGPRINAVSRIQGDASFCVELLTSRDVQRCDQLALETELANIRRKEVQKNVAEQVKKKLTQMDLSTTSVIVLCDNQWANGVLGLVAAEIARDYGRPTILLTIDEEGKFARGSARSVNNIDLYELVNSQRHLLHRFGGHPFAAGLSLAVENIPLFTEAINQQLRQISLSSGEIAVTTPQADLLCTASDLGKELFWELKILEPWGMGNPAPQLLIQNCWFDKVWNQNPKDLRGKKVQFIKTEFLLWDETATVGFPGVWWGHYRDEVPQGYCHCIVELDFNAYKKRYEVRLIAVQPVSLHLQQETNLPEDWMSDYRGIPMTEKPENAVLIQECPTRWDELQVQIRRAMQQQQKVAIAYHPPTSLSPSEIWQQLVGIAKYLSRTGKGVTKEDVRAKLNMSDRTLTLGLRALSHLGFEMIDLPDSADSNAFSLQQTGISPHPTATPTAFISALREEQFRQQYFYQVPLSTLQAIALQGI